MAGVGETVGTAGARAIGMTGVNLNEVNMKKAKLLLRNTILSLIMVTAAVAPLFADVLYLNDGQALRGRVVSQNDDAVTIETNSGQEIIEAGQIDRIEYSRSRYGDEDGSSQGYGTGRRLMQTELIFKLGSDFGGQLNIYNGSYYQGNYGTTLLSGVSDTTSALTLTTEYIGYFTNQVGLGIGLTEQFPRKQTKHDGYFSFTPLYGLIKVRTIPDDRNYYKYLTAHLGGNTFSADSQYAGDGASLGGGLYYAAGGGMVFNFLQIELLYTVNYGSVSQSGLIYNSATGNYDPFNNSADVRHSTLNLNFGIVF